MNAMPATTTATSAPFSRGAVIAIVVLGAALFIALLWMIGTGNGLDDTNDGQGHVDGRGLNGFAAMAAYLEARGHPVERVRGEGGHKRPQLLVLTPPAGADGGEIARIVNSRQNLGPTLVISPKWIATPPSAEQRTQGADKGWVTLAGTTAPNWRGFLDDVVVNIGDVDANGQSARWKAVDDLTGELPDRKNLEWGWGPGLVPLVTEMDGRMLAVLVRKDAKSPERVVGRYPLVLVFEPDLFDNYGMQKVESAMLLDRLVAFMGVRKGDSVAFDLTLNGHGRPRNLLTLAFTPPYLAVTLCLLMAAMLAGWRAFLRFGPPLSSGPAIAYGKRTLVENLGGLVQRSRRFHLLGRPYAERARTRLMRALALPHTLDPARAEAAIDRALAVRLPDAEPFSSIAARLGSARRAHDVLKGARELHALERKLTR